MRRFARFALLIRHLAHPEMDEHTHTKDICESVCVLKCKAYDSPLSIYSSACGANQRAGCLILYPLHHLTTRQRDSSGNLCRQSLLWIIFDLVWLCVDTCVDRKWCHDVTFLRVF